MDQYRPSGQINSDKFSEVDRRITLQEYESAIRSANHAGITRLDQRKFSFF
jgi:uncharacterized Fe-S radical SAM superfamily protein PflX